MNYISCKLCNAVWEDRTVWQPMMNMQNHIEKVHPDIWKEIEANEERYEKEKEPLLKALEQIKKPMGWRDYVVNDNMSKEEGRKEFGDRRINLRSS